MRRAALWLSLAALPWPAACTAAESFVCTADTQCMADGEAGRCEAEGVCSFPDDACPSGRRYGKLAGELSGQCVGEGTSGEASGADTRAITSEDTLALDGEGTTTSSTSTTSTATSSTSTTEGMPTTDATATSGTSMTGPDLTTGTEPDPYGPCIDGDECAEPGSVCITGPTNMSVCAPLCDDETECPPVLGNAANIVCTPVGMASMGCVIICMTREDCPPDMQCELLEGGIGYCGWP